MRGLTLHAAAYVAGILFGALLMQCEPLVANAQASEHAAWQADVVALARLCVNEAGWPAPDGTWNDCAAIGRYARSRAADAGESVAAYIARVHHRHTSPTRRTRVWVRGLDGALERPAGWPEDLDWETWGRPRWARALAEAANVLRGRNTACVEVPHTWGGPYVDRERIERMLANGWRRIDCGNTRNVYLRRS